MKAGGRGVEFCLVFVARVDVSHPARKACATSVRKKIANSLYNRREEWTGGLGRGGWPTYRKGRTAPPAAYLPANCKHDQSLLFSQPRRDSRPVGDVETAVVSRGGHGLSREPLQTACCAQPRRRWLSFSSRIQACRALTKPPARPRVMHTAPPRSALPPFASLNSNGQRLAAVA